MLWIKTRSRRKTLFWTLAVTAGLLWGGLPLADAAGAGSLIGGTSIGDIEALAKRGTAEPMALPPQNGCQTSESIALHTGEFTWSLDDLALPGRGPDLIITHTYKSGSNIRGRWGRGWHLNLDMRLLPLESGNRLLVDETGRKHEFVKRADEPGYDPPAGVHHQLTVGEDETAILTLKHGTQYHFDADGKLTRIQDPNGNAVTLEYEPEKTSVRGTSEFFVDQDSGILARTAELKKVTDAVGREATFSYNDDGRLTAITGPGERQMQYAYDARGNLIQITDPLENFYAFTYDENHHLLTAADPEGVVYIENTYDAQERVIAQKRNGQTFAFSYDAQAHTATVTNPNGSKDHYTFSACCGNPTRIARDMDGLNLVTEYTYDDDLNLLSVTDPNGNPTQYTYDDNGNMLTVLYPDGSQTTYSYTADFNRVAGIVVAQGPETNFSYDERGNLTQVVNADNKQKKFSYAADTGDLTLIDMFGARTGFDYNELGYVSTVTDAVGNDLAIQYDTWGNITSLTDRNGHTTTFGYDLKGQLISITDALENTTEFRYDKTGRLVERIEPVERSTTFTYTDFGRLRQVVDALGDPVALAYDDAGVLQTVTDAGDNPTTYRYDAVGRLVEITDALENTTAYAYDANGNLTGVTDPNGNPTAFTYDNRNRVVRIDYPDNTFETFEYSIIGNRVSRTDRKGKEWTFSYDILNRMTRKTHEDGRVVSYEYDDFGRLTLADNGIHVAAYTYNPLGRITTAALADKSVQYTYDAAGNRASITLGNTNIQYTYDALNRLKQIKDSAGAVIFAAYTYAHDNDNNPTVTAALANQAIQRVITYDAVDRIRQMATTVAGESRTGFAYTYDGVGNRTRKTVRGNAQSFVYNAIDRLTQADFPGGFPFAEPSFAYDPAGNRTSADTGTALQYEINAMNQYAKVGDAAYAWDANGNLTNDGTDAYTYDVENRLTRFQSIQFTYDAAGRLITRSNAGGDVSRYVYDFNGIIAEYNAAGDLTHRYIRRPDTGELVAAINGATYYYVTDALGSPAEILDPTGALVERYAYDAYGHVSMTDSGGDLLEASSFGNPFFFAGMLHDPIGLYAAGNRFYSPDLGRFIQAGAYDRYGNAYTYAGNNPTSNAPKAGLTLPKPKSGLFNGNLGVATGDHAPSAAPWSDALVPNPNRPNLCGSEMGRAFPSLVPAPAPMKGLVPERPGVEVGVD